MGQRPSTARRRLIPAPRRFDQRHAGRRAARRPLLLPLLAVVAMLAASCERSPAVSSTQPAQSTQPSRAGKHPTVASLVPAATDLILGMQAGEHLVAVSNWDAPQAAIAGLPRAGDYRDVDWEKLTQVRPE